MKTAIVQNSKTKNGNENSNDLGLKQFLTDFKKEGSSCPEDYRELIYIFYGNESTLFFPELN